MITTHEVPMPSHDGKNRCFGNDPDQENYAHYHDHEWGIPTYDDSMLFEMLILEGAQAGLNWYTILKKRQGYREAFHHFDAEKVATMSDADLEALRDNPAIIRNRLKIYSARQNARVFLQIQQEYGSFSSYLWSFVDHSPIINHHASFEEVPSQTPISQALSIDLKKRGMNFVGPTIIYAYMQSVGMVDDHLQSCWRYNDQKST